MNYYERHLGDYARDTAHLTMLEHGAYGLLLDRYYATETGIPADQVHRLARARSPAERAAVDAVLAEFFVLTDGVWINSRAAREVAKALVKIEAARTNGKSGGRPKKNRQETDQKPNGFTVGLENETQAKAHQTPDTRHQTPDTRHQTPDKTHTPPLTQTEGGRVCGLMRQAGLPDGNPGHPDMLALIAAGATDAEFVGAAHAAAGKGKGFAYAIGTLKRQRIDAASSAGKLHVGPMHTGPPDRKSVQLQTAALMTGATRQQPREIIDVTPITIAS